MPVFLLDCHMRLCASKYHEYRVNDRYDDIIWRNISLELTYRLCQKKIYNFQYLIVEKVNKAQQ